jgi:hypothetical protein
MEQESYKMNTKPKTTRRRNISITDADYAALAMLGNGNASQGIREALKSCQAEVKGAVI